MRSIKIIFAQGTDIYRNLALEETLFRTVPRGETRVFLWSNTDCVVIGRNQDPARECHLDVMEELGVRLARRKTGGGAVYHDPGNLNVSFLARPEDCPEELRPQIVLRTLERCGIRCEKTGRNDLCETETGRKISGSASMQSGERLLTHGTLMVDVDIARMEACLQPAQEKLDRHFVSSVRARVANLTEFRPGLTVQDLQESLITSAEDMLLQKAEVIRESAGESFTEMQGFDEERICEQEKRYRSQSWILSGEIGRH